MSRRKSSFHIPGVSFSWNRALGITNAKRKIARATGIPTTRSGRQRKAARMMGCSGCLVELMGIVFALSTIVLIIICGIL